MKIRGTETKQYQLKNILIKLDHTYLKTPDTKKIPLKIAIPFTSSKDNGEERVMYSKSDNRNDD